MVGDATDNRDPNLTVAFDHDVVDGAPAARFLNRLVEMIESGYGLEVARDDAPASPPGPR